MKIEDRIKENFSKKNLVGTIARYELYYQIALGVFIRESSFEDEDVAKKIDELKLDIDIENILNTVLKVISSFYEEEDFKMVLEDNLRLNAFLHALRDFVNKNDELENKENVYQAFHDKVMDDEFYNMKMHIYFEEELGDRVAYWETLISDKSAKELCESALKMI